jgi:hypothetical protein
MTAAALIGLFGVDCSRAGASAGTSASAPCCAKFGQAPAITGCEKASYPRALSDDKRGRGARARLV